MSDESRIDDLEREIKELRKKIDSENAQRFYLLVAIVGMIYAEENQISVIWVLVLMLIAAITRSFIKFLNLK